MPRLRPEKTDGPPLGQGEAGPPDFTDQPRVRLNDHGVLDVPPLGGWSPVLSVSVVVPAHGQPEKLALVLASLAGQSYPSHLMEVVVVDDGSAEPLVLPEVCPQNTRIVSSGPGGWGSAHAVNTGVAVSSGQVVLRLDADMLVYREHVESQMRWHHLVDYGVVMGHKLFVDFDPSMVEGELSPGRVREEVRAGRADRLFDRESADPHWVEAVIERGNGLRDSGHKAYRVFIGATGSMHRTLFDEAGGMDPAMVLGGDSELGYRLAQRGALFVPDLDTSSWHLGRSQMQTRRDAGTRYRSPHIANRVPDYHLRRKSPERIWEVPRADVVVQAGGFSLEEVEATAARVLAGTAPDIRLWLVGPWSGIGDGRCSPLEEECLDLRLIREAFRGDPRVRFSEEVPEEDPQVPFRLYVPTGSLPLRGMVADLVKLADADGAGLVCVPVPGATREGDGVLRMERAAAFARARHLEPGAGGGDLDRVVEAVSGIRWASAQDIVDVPEGADTTWSAVRAGAVRRRAGADLSPAELRRELARAQAEVARLKHKVERTERKLRWFTPGLTRRVLRRIAR